MKMCGYKFYFKMEKAVKVLAEKASGPKNSLG